MTVEMKRKPFLVCVPIGQSLVEGNNVSERSHYHLERKRLSEKIASVLANSLERNDHLRCVLFLTSTRI